MGTDNDSRGPPIGRAEFWAKVAAGVFAMWALMIPLGIGVFRDVLHNNALDAAAIIAENTRFYAEFRAYVLAMERRTTQIEERQAMVLKSIDTLRHNSDVRDERLDRLERQKGRLGP